MNNTIDCARPPQPHGQAGGRVKRFSRLGFAATTGPFVEPFDDSESYSSSSWPQAIPGRIPKPTSRALGDGYEAFLAAVSVKVPTAAVSIGLVFPVDSGRISGVFSEKIMTDAAMRRSPSRSVVEMQTVDPMQREHLNYLKEVSSGDDPLVSSETAKLAERAWDILWRASGNRMPIPAACTGPDGQMLYAWDRGKHHLELEIIPGRCAEFFYKDRETRELWGEDYSIGEPLPAEAVKKLRYFLEGGFSA